MQQTNNRGHYHRRPRQEVSRALIKGKNSSQQKSSLLLLTSLNELWLYNTGSDVFSVNSNASNHLKRSQLGVGFRWEGARPPRHVSGIQKSGHNSFLAATPQLCSFLDHTAIGWEANTSVQCVCWSAVFVHCQGGGRSLCLVSTKSERADTANSDTAQASLVGFLNIPISFCFLRQELFTLRCTTEAETFWNRHHTVQ